MLPNFPTDSIDAFGQLSTSIDHDNLLTQYINKGLIHGYSVARKLVNTSNNLQAFRVRRSSDNAEQDIGFIGNDVDTSDLLTFVGANNGFVADVYDQISTSDVSQSNNSRQWRVVNSGSLISINNILGMRDDSVLSSSQYSISPVIDLTNLTVFSVISTPGSGGHSVVFLEGSGDTDLWFVNGDSHTIQFRANAAMASTDSTPFLDDVYQSYCVTFDINGNVKLYRNNTEELDTSITYNATQFSDFLRHGPAGTGTHLFAETIIFNTLLNETDRYTVNKNIDDFYGI